VLADQHFSGSERDETIPKVTVERYMSILGARYHIGDGLGIDAALPVGLIEHQDEAVIDQFNRPKLTRMSGLGDLDIGVRYDLSSLWGRLSNLPIFALRLGVILPTGRAGSAGLLTSTSTPVLVSLGSGSFALSLRGDLTYFVHPRVAISVPVGLRAPLTFAENAVRGGVSATYGLGIVGRPLDILTLMARVQGSSSLKGEIKSMQNNEKDGSLLNSGGTVLAAEVLVGVNVHEDVLIAVQGRYPFWRTLAGTQVTESFSVSGSLVVTFGGDDETSEQVDTSNQLNAGALEGTSNPLNVNDKQDTTGGCGSGCGSGCCGSNGDDQTTTDDMPEDVIR
jgi:hypothetical protein